MTSGAIVAAPSACADLLPADWKNGVEHTSPPEPAAPKPQGDQATVPFWRAMTDWTLVELKKWTGFGVSEAAKLDQANGRTADAIGIVERCEARDAKAVKRSRPKVLGIF